MIGPSFTRLMLLGLVVCAAASTAAAQDELKVAMLSEPVSVVQESNALPTVEVLKELARSDQVAFLQELRNRYLLAIHDYTATLVKKERLQEKLGDAQVIHCRFRSAPFSVYLKWDRGATSADRLLYVPAQLGPNILARPKGLVGWFVKSVEVDPHCDKARKASLQTVDRFGWVNTMNRLIRKTALAVERNELSTLYLGPMSLNGQKTIAVEYRFPEKTEYGYGRIRLHFYRQSLLPAAFLLWDWDERPLAEYAFSDVRVNVGLDDDDFSPKSCGL